LKPLSDNVNGILLMAAGIVIASGHFVFMRERQLGRQTTLAAPTD
jgi:hypothetical protein